MLFGKKSGIKNRNRERYERVRRLMWIKCESCGKLVYYKDYKENKYICPRCGHGIFGKWHSLGQIEGGIEGKVREIVWMQIIKDFVYEYE